MMALFDGEFWPFLFGGLSLAVTLTLSVHILLRKRNERAAVAWFGLIWLSPVIGAILYLMLGINRIQRRASQLRPERQSPARAAAASAAACTLSSLLPPESRHMVTHSTLVDKVTRNALTTGNRVTPLVNGETAYPAMLAAIEGAQNTVALSTYIFNNDVAGRSFVDALEQAVARGVVVRVLIDGVGSWYSIPPIVGLLQRRNVPVARFLHSFVPWRMPYLNLRNHQKLLIVDGSIGFTGGMNIKRGHILGRAAGRPVRDVHFRIDGPVVAQMMRAFADDWSFTTEETLHGETWFPALQAAGTIAARGLSAGPDEEADSMLWALLNALAEAQRSITIVTPYFLPDDVLLTGLKLAAMRGVAITVVLPEINNLAFVKWASMVRIDELIALGCRVLLTPPPFDHSKLLIVDEIWTLVGSTNWDPRSLRLNFEFNVECYDTALAADLAALVADKTRNARPLTVRELSDRSLPVKLRDSLAKLFAPYL